MTQLFLLAKGWTWRQWLVVAIGLAVVFFVTGWLLHWTIAAFLGVGTTVAAGRGTWKAVEEEVKRQNEEEAAKIRRATVAIRQEAANKINRDAEVIEIGSPCEAKDALLGALADAKESRR